MRLLLLGGTAFVGRAIVETALARGHEVSLFSRGLTGTDLFPEVERLVGDRDSGDYASLAEGEWDAVIDVSAYLPRNVTQAADALGDRIGRYLFISTISVYDMAALAPGADESAARLAPRTDTEEVTGESYGPLKVACEDVLAERFGDRLTIVRPAIVAGPHDATDRFTYWTRRAERGGRMALPADPDQPIQIVDVRDLADLVVSLVENNQPGTYTGVGAEDPVTLTELARACAAVFGTSLDVVPVTPRDPAFPLTLPDPALYDFFRLSSANAQAAGLGKTPLAKTVADTAAWDHERGLPDLAVGPTPEQEEQLLA
jgi:2'-hydroxyisoflavone reductase